VTVSGRSGATTPNGKLVLQQEVLGVFVSIINVDVVTVTDPPPLKWPDLRYAFDIKEGCNAEEEIQA
jgi:hypothetical protein